MGSFAGRGVRYELGASASTVVGRVRVSVKVETKEKSIGKEEGKGTRGRKRRISDDGDGDGDGDGNGNGNGYFRNGKAVMATRNQTNARRFPTTAERKVRYPKIQKTTMHL